MSEPETMTIDWVKEAQFLIETRRHRLLVDQPADDGGRDEGMTPVELLIGALGSCIGHFAARFFLRHQLGVDRLRVTMAWDYAERPHRVGTITARVHLPVALEPEVLARLQKVVEGCTVHNTLAHPPAISVRIETVTPSLAKSRTAAGDP